MFTKVLFSNEEDYKKALNYFPKEYIEKLLSKPTFRLSIQARYALSLYISEVIGIKNYFPQVDNVGKPIFDNKIYWSISHSQELIFIGVGSSPLGIDIEVFKQRDESLFLQKDAPYYENMGKNRISFYLLWTAKESIIKALGESLDKIESIQFHSTLSKTTDTKGNTKHKFLFDLGGEFYKVESDFKNENSLKYFTSICIR